MKEVVFLGVFNFDRTDITQIMYFKTLVKNKMTEFQKLWGVAHFIFAWVCILLTCCPIQQLCSKCSYQIKEIHIPLKEVEVSN